MKESWTLANRDIYDHERRRVKITDHFKLTELGFENELKLSQIGGGGGEKKKKNSIKKKKERVGRGGGGGVK